MDVGSFAGLVEQQEVLPRLVAAIEAAVLRSFEGRQGLVIIPGRVTSQESRRRVGLCLDIVKVLRGDLKWSWERVIDYIPLYLEMSLDGQAWEPDARSSWAPSKR